MGDSNTERVACQVELEGCVLFRPSPSETPEVCGQPSSVPFYMSTIRSVLCSLSFYKGSETCCHLPEKFRSLPYCLYRQYSGNKEIPGQIPESHCLIALLEGFIFNMVKSMLTPSQQIKFLGLQLDTFNMCLSLPGYKIKTIRGEATQLLQ